MNGVKALRLDEISTHQPTKVRHLRAQKAVVVTAGTLAALVLWLLAVAVLVTSPS